MWAVRAGVLYTGVPGEVLRNVYVVYGGDGLIRGVFRRRPRGVEEVLEAGVVTPAFIDPHSHIGLVRHGEHPEEGEVNERFESVLPMADALYSIHLDDPSFRESVEHGVLYSCVLPGSANIIGGRGVVVRNYGADVEDAYMGHAGIKVALGFNPRTKRSWSGNRPHTNMGVVAILKKWLEKARDTLRLVEKGKKELEEVDPEVRSLFPALRGEETLRVHVHKDDEIVGLLMLRREFNLKVTVEHAGDAHRRETFEKLGREGVPVVYGPIDSFAYKTELRHESWRNLKLLLEARPLFGLMSDHPVVLQRNLFLQLRFFLRLGMSRSEAISIITLNNAKILGIDDKLGSIEKGKLASLVLWSGDPFNLESRPTRIIAEGKVIWEEESGHRG